MSIYHLSVTNELWVVNESSEVYIQNTITFVSIIKLVIQRYSAIRYRGSAEPAWELLDRARLEV